MVFICYPKCSTCKKAQAWLKAQGLDCEVRDIQKDNPAMTEEEQLALLATDGMLVKRPILLAGEQVLVGFQEAQWAQALL